MTTKRGRPRLPDEKAKANLTIRLEPGLRDRLESMARQQSIRLAELVRRLLAAAIR